MDGFESSDKNENNFLLFPSDIEVRKALWIAKVILFAVMCLENAMKSYDSPFLYLDRSVKRLWRTKRLRVIPYGRARY